MNNAYFVIKHILYIVFTYLKIKTFDHVQLRDSIHLLYDRHLSQSDKTRQKYTVQILLKLELKFYQTRRSLQPF